MPASRAAGSRCRIALQDRADDLAAGSARRGVAAQGARGDDLALQDPRLAALQDPRCRIRAGAAPPCRMTCASATTSCVLERPDPPFRVVFG
jgi:hypothetical protein